MFQCSFSESVVVKQGNRYYVKDRLAGWTYVTPDGTRTYVSPRKRSSDHFFRKFGGWAVSSELLAVLLQEGVETVELKIEGEGYLSASLKTWMQNGIQNREDGFEEQTVLAESQLASNP